MKRIGVVTENVMLYRKIKLELSEICEVTMLDSPIDGYDGILVDKDNPRFSAVSGIKMSRYGADISLPFRLGSLRAMFKDESTPLLRLGDGGEIFIGTRSVKLTDVELALFNALYNRHGQYANRSELVREVWGIGTDEGILNVYIHYLRMKLEAGGDRVITCSRGRGYKINEECLGGKNA